MNKGLKRIKCPKCKGTHYVRRPRGDQVLAYVCKKSGRLYLVWNG